MTTSSTQEELRLEAALNQKAHWRKWGPYLSDRQWGTVREDYSPHGEAWDYFSHESSRSRAYRCGMRKMATTLAKHQLHPDGI